jgi:hypothetical protein
MALASAEEGAEIRPSRAFQLEYGGPRIFVNVPDAHQITVVDRSTGWGR